MNDAVIEIESLSKSFGRKKVLEDVTLTVERGKTYAFLGRNGAGKTTTIRIVMGLLRPSGGRVRVLGLDPGRDAIEIRRRVGYLAEDQKMFGWMRVRQLLRFLRPFYPTWNQSMVDRLVRRFELPLQTKVKHLSKGQKVRLGLLLTMAHRPELVILDDPTLGLDPIVRKDFLRDMVTYLQSIDTTVFFSSHLLYEVEPVADVVAILNDGVLMLKSPTEELRQQVKRLLLPVRTYEALGSLPGALDVERRGGQVSVVVENAEAVLTRARAAGIQPEVIDLNLDEIFEAYVIGRPHGQNDSKTTVERVA